jgi:hypothetical protein
MVTIMFAPDSASRHFIGRVYIASRATRSGVAASSPRDLIGFDHPNRGGSAQQLRQL